MKSFVIAVLLVFIIDGNANSSSNKYIQITNREPYKACLRISERFNINLKCEKLAENINIQNVQILPKTVAKTRKVNKKEEMKLRQYLFQLSNENKRLNGNNFL